MEKRYIILRNICSIYIDLLLVFSLLIEDSISTFHRVICTIPNALDCEYLMCEITVCVCVCVYAAVLLQSHVQLFVTPGAVCQALLSMGFPM